MFTCVYQFSNHYSCLRFTELNCTSYILLTGEAANNSISIRVKLEEYWITIAQTSILPCVHSQQTSVSVQRLSESLVLSVVALGTTLDRRQTRQMLY
jgi:hypothetical protein